MLRPVVKQTGVSVVSSWVLREHHEHREHPCPPFQDNVEDEVEVWSNAMMMLHGAM